MSVAEPVGAGLAWTSTSEYATSQNRVDDAVNFEAEHRTLCEQATTRDPDAIDALLARHLGALRAFVRLRMGAEVRGRESASDLVQSVCREVLEKLDAFEYRGEAAFKAWLFTLGLSKVRDRFRRHTAGRRDVRRETPGGDYSRVYADLVTPSRHMILREDTGRIEAAFDRLTEEQREVITLARIAGLPHRQIAQRLGKSEEACRKLLQRGLVALSWELSADPT